MKKKDTVTFDELAGLARAVSDTGRLRALVALRHGELCVCRLIELLALAPSTVSKHMAILKQAGLVQSRKDGRWVYYRLADTGRNLSADRFAEFVLAAAGLDTGHDEQRLRRICATDADELCRRQKRGYQREMQR